MIALGWLAKTHAKHMHESAVTECACNRTLGAACAHHTAIIVLKPSKLVCQSWKHLVWGVPQQLVAMGAQFKVWDCPTALWCGNFFTGLQICMEHTPWHPHWSSHCGRELSRQPNVAHYTHPIATAEISVERKFANASQCLKRIK